MGMAFSAYKHTFAIIKQTKNKLLKVTIEITIVSIELIIEKTYVMGSIWNYRSFYLLSH